MRRITPTSGAFLWPLAAMSVTTALALEQPMPASTSPQFCIAAQQKLASTALVGANTVFDDMPSYRHSKPAAQPLTIFQVVTYTERLPVVVSCKVKSAAHLRAAFGEDAAGQQFFCHDIARTLQQRAIAELRNEGQTEAADRAASFVIDRDEPFITGRDYLADFRSIYRSEDGVVHVSSPVLFQDYDKWYTVLLPEIVKGQSYCHLATVESLKAVAAGEMAPGKIYNTLDDAPTRAP